MKSFFNDYLTYYRKNNLEELMPVDHPVLWDKIIVDFKNKTRFFTRGEDENSIIFNNFVKEIITKQSKIFKKFRKHKIDTSQIGNQAAADIYTDTRLVTKSLPRLIESLFKNSPQKSKIKVVSKNADNFRDYLFSIENDDENEMLLGDWNNRQCFNRKLKYVLTNLNGLVHWYVTFNSNRGRVTYDVYNNDLQCDLYKEGNGFKHTLIFPGPVSQ